MERFTQPIKQFFSQFFPFRKGRPELIEEKLNPFAKKQFSGLKFVHYASLGAVAGVSSLFILYSSSKFLSETYIEEVPIGGLTIEEAMTQLQNQYPEPTPHLLSLHFSESDSEKVTEIASSSAELGASYQYETTVKTLFAQQKENRIEWIKRLLVSSPQKVGLTISYSSEKLMGLVEAFKGEFNLPPEPPKATLGQTGNPRSLALSLGKNVSHIDTAQTLASIQEEIDGKITLSQIQEKNGELNFSPITNLVSESLTEEQKKKALETLSLLVGKELVLKFDVFTEKIPDTTLISLLEFPEGFSSENLKKITEEWKTKLDRPSQNAVFEYDKQTLTVTQFTPHKNGLALNEEKTQEEIKTGILDILEKEISSETPSSIEKTLVFIETTPEKTLEQTNSLGIKERIGFGESYYAHSIPTRIHNVSLTAERINYALVAPGKEFSFNKTLGDVSSATGFQPAYVIKDGQTTLGDGGGVCQVSSTLFRSVLDAGLKITLRLPHSYRVSYYELNSNPGFDATVYSGNVDFRFINDTEDYVLIYTSVNSADLYMTVELYGTSDGRTTEISDYKSWDSQPPLPTQYIPDPSLPHGKLKQVDWSASGIKTKFTHTIRDKNGEVMSEKVYTSNYRPWAAKYLQGI